MELPLPPLPSRAPCCSALIPHYPGLWTEAYYLWYPTGPPKNACQRQLNRQKTHSTSEDGGWRGGRAHALRSGGP